MRRPPLLLSALASLALLAGCTVHPVVSGTGTSPVEPGPGTTASAPATPATSSATSAPITINLVGDVHFARWVEPLADDPQAFAGIAPVLGAADLTVANMETAITTRGAEEPKAWTFRTKPEAIIPLKNAGVDLLTMANNHAADYGPIGLQDTLAAKAGSPVPIIGIGADDAEAFAPWVASVRGTTIAFINADEIWDETTLAKFSAGPGKPGVANGYDRTRLVQAVREARASYDVVIVIEHWGVENTSCASPRQQETVRILAEAGADAVIGGHAHIPQGAGWMGPTFVGYGLGNFIWASYDHFSGRSGILQISVDPAKAKARKGDVVTSYTWRPVNVQPNGSPALTDDALNKQEWADSIACSGLAQR